MPSYPLLFLRAIIKMRLWEFRLPDYPKLAATLPQPGAGLSPASACGCGSANTLAGVPRLRSSSRSDGVPPEPSVAFTVRSSPGRWRVTLKLTRYKAAKLVSGQTPSGAIQVKAIMMMNGFAQPTLPFVATEIPQNLAECFYEMGYDVWLFDYRSSTILDASKLACTMDDIAEFDIPRAVDHILGNLRSELKFGANVKIQIYAFTHCVGSASMAMSLLAGKLADQDKVSKIAGVILSQMQPFLVGSKTNQMRLQTASFLRDVAGIGVLRLSAAEKQPTAFESLLDRLYASLPTTDAERCPHENDRVEERPDIATCKRMTGTLSRLLKHDQIKKETHRKLSIYFGRANTTLFVHGAKCVDYERLVNADGQNVYVTDENILRYFRLPMAFLHGRENVLFDYESFTRTLYQLTRVQGTEFAKVYYRPICAEGYAHFDCTVGKNAYKDIFPRLRDFLNQAWQLNENGGKKEPLSTEDSEPGLRSEARAPVTGPIVGWTRAGDLGKRMVRMWMQVDEYETDMAQFVLTAVRPKAGAASVRYARWPIIRIPLEQAGAARVAIAIADLELNSNSEAYEIDMVSVHYLPYAKRGGVPPGKVNRYLPR